jgi:hypothetical protein
MLSLLAPFVTILGELPQHQLLSLAFDECDSLPLIQGKN